MTEQQKQLLILRGKQIVIFLILAALGIWIFNSVFGAILGGGASLVGAGDKKKKIAESKIKAEESEKRQQYHEKSSAVHTSNADKHHDQAQEAAEKEHEQLSGKDLENAFSNRSSRRPRR